MKQRIPTLLALILLLVTVGLAIFLYFNQKNNTANQIKQFNPQGILVANITDSSASILWHTDTPTTAKVKLNNQSQTDDRDEPQSPAQRLTHFVTISSLSPDTLYQYQLEINGILYPETPLEFKTLSQALNEKAINEQSYQPIRGSVLNPKQDPADEAIIIIKLPNAIPKATFVTTAGNYILPLTRLVNAEQTDTIQITDNQPATLEIKKSSLTSLVQITLPIKDRALAPITLGKNENLIDFLAQPATIPQPLEFEQTEISFDLNNDGKVNTLDSSLITDLITRRQFNPSADFNNDKVIDNEDLELIKDRLE